MYQLDTDNRAPTRTLTANQPGAPALATHFASAFHSQQQQLHYTVADMPLLHSAYTKQFTENNG